MNASRPTVGETVRDTQRDRIGVVMGHVGPHVQLRPLGGGREWDADPARLERVPVSTALRPLVAEANARSRKGER
ncbi:hypothetical protein AQ490_12945 [Wenjunlia vitaminophila]|uniref:Uncharacterized protein n=2 Tax=Wenjunlia vitaminophila TaxID=76728 RepID=A0A0T6LXT0_WENVI|nr:hypothetical protein AQ490_12945 [Wenjunlia vitaminophila]